MLFRVLSGGHKVREGADMSKSVKRVLAVLTVCAALPTGYAFARDHGHGYYRGHQVRVEHHERNEWKHHDRDSRRDNDAWRRHEHERWERTHEHQKWNADHRPPGWDHGRKTGWGNCNVAPGHAKKEGCYGHDRDRWRDHRVNDSDRQHHPYLPNVSGRPHQPIIPGSGSHSPIVPAAGSQPQSTSPTQPVVTGSNSSQSKPRIWPHKN